MKIGLEMAGAEVTKRRQSAGEADRQFVDRDYAQVMGDVNTAWMTSGSRLQQLSEAGREEEAFGNAWGEDGDNAVRQERSEAEKIYQAAVSGKKNPIEELRRKPKVPYEHLAKDGVIIYNGVCFACDERSNSICLGDMTDEKNVLNIALSGGGHLKVNRDNLGDLSKAVGMFSPEDLNLIMRAIAQDTKIQSMKKEIEDEKVSVGNRLENENV